MFERVARRITSGNAKGRHAASAPSSIFSGLIRCVHCGGSVVKVSKGAHVYLVCSKANAKGGCRYLAVPYSNAERALRENINALIDGAPRGSNAPGMDEKVYELEHLVEECAEEARGFAREARATASPTMRAQLREAEGRLAQAKARLKEASDLRERLSGPFVSQRLDQLRAAFSCTNPHVSEINRRLKATIARFELDPTEGKLWVYWRDADEPDYLTVESRHWAPFEQSDCKTTGTNH